MKKNIRCIVCGCRRKPAHEKNCGTDKANSPACVPYEKFDRKAYKAEQKKIAKEKADEIVRIKAEEVARVKAEAEEVARVKKEADEKLIAEAKALEEIEAAERADKAASEKAEKIAKKQAEREAREKAEKEAREKAEQEAKSKAEAETKEITAANSFGMKVEAVVLSDEQVTEAISKSCQHSLEQAQALIKEIEKDEVVEEVPEIKAKDLIPPAELLASDVYKTNKKIETLSNAKPIERIN